MTFSRSPARLLVLAVAAVSCNLSFAFADALDAPASYYNAATGTGATLKSQLYTITSTGFVSRTYGDARYALSITDRDPANSSKIILLYNRASINGTWDFGSTWNREHIWPKSLLGLTSAQVDNNYSGVASDLFELRPANPNINSNRSNYPYGKSAISPLPAYGTVSDSTGTYWYPGDADRGDVARSIFYMATRYGQGQTHNITLVNNQPATYQMGDLATLLRWHYQDPVDSFERTRNQLVYSSALNPQYYQGNRNPFIDHPEYVWSIFGTGANTSRLSVATAAVDGSSNTSVDLGRVISGASFGTGAVTLSKSGTTPTTFDATVAGNATSTLSGPRNTFDYDAGTKTVTVGLTGSTSTLGVRSGTITFDNTDITAGAATGQGAADGNDVVNVSGTVVSHAQPSFDHTSVVKSLALDFGIIAQGASTISGSIELANAGTVGSYVAGLDVDSIIGTGDTAAFTNDLAPSSNLDVGLASSYIVSATTGAIGEHAASYTVATSDENIPGATALDTLSLSVRSRIAIAGDASLDDHVDFVDLVILAQNYNAANSTWMTGDFDRSGTTNFADLVALAQHYNASAAAVASLTNASFAADWALAQSLVPEPTTLISLGGVMTLITRRRR